MTTRILNSIFDQDDLIRAYDRIFPFAKHYRNVLSIHLRELENCEYIIDLGCGTGNITLKLLKMGKFITAVDKSQRSLDILKKKVESFEFSANLKPILADITNLNSEIGSESFDGANSLIVAHLVKQYKKHIEESYRILKAGGRFVITARNVGQDQELLVKSVKKSLVGRGDFEKLKSDFELIRDNLLMTANDRSKSLMLPQEAEDLLHKVGFRDILLIPNKTDRVMYSLVATKP